MDGQKPLLYLTFCIFLVREKLVNFEKQCFVAVMSILDSKVPNKVRVKHNYD